MYVVADGIGLEGVLGGGGAGWEGLGVELWFRSVALLITGLVLVGVRSTGYRGHQ